ncbi:16S rRNA (uracil(1498)-N(3))-methyltransferase [Paenibacillus beijingensis]|uniref:Ribosomal RNA small subunit methyltransferase E n=1 Tax=Paenibacillus beijingensis TaxID=1126833 RepID=A0A0D5NM27_9BACL|nr:16S rRNA (uracil(1498)-N(3))-methyltransferase [Paenibacillus beijingensis]AJY76311.1 16S rRNA methyltransferase [Paenibacillus beijingensis]
MQRYFVPREQFFDTEVVLSGEDARHAARVMRMKPGDEMIVSDGAGREARVSVTEIGSAGGEVRADIVELLPADREPKWQVTIAQALPKGDKMELVIQKGTEIGAFAFVPFQSERMIVQYDARKEAKRIERWQRIAKEAAEQSHRSRVPLVADVYSWRELIALAGEYDLTLFCYEKEGSAGAGIRSALQAAADRSAFPTDDAVKVLLIVGPEGGFTEKEAAEAEAAGATVVGLGKRILRAETAGLVGLACIMYESGEMGGD